MNIERLTEIAEWLEAGAPVRNGVDGFDMSDFSQPAECGTAFCLAGTAIHWYFPGGLDGAEKSLEVIRLSDAAIDVLGITRAQADLLFFPRLEAPDQTDATLAARVIRHLIATGEVDWNATRGDV